MRVVATVAVGLHICEAVGAIVVARRRSSSHLKLEISHALHICEVVGAIMIVRNKLVQKAVTLLFPMQNIYTLYSIVKRNIAIL